jgi:riboflavin kinase/FMN adenylyltransferase
MELIRGLHNLRPRHRGCVVAQGAFDGVHRGHQVVLSRLKDKGRELGLPTVVMCFEPLPREYFAPAASPARLMSFREKFAALRDFGIDRVLRIPFDASFSEMEANDFVRDVFRDGLGAKFVVVGDDQRFGKNREGDFELLRTLGKKYGFDVESTNSVTVEGVRASSTRIREALEQGDFSLAAELLGRPYSMTGRVMVGNQLGRTLDAPTANVHLHRLRSALSGVYAVEIEGAGTQKEVGVANVGTRPTIGDLTRAILEVHIFDFNRNIYRRNITVTFCEKLREERKFNSLSELQQQIHRDFAIGRRYFALDE